MQNVLVPSRGSCRKSKDSRVLIVIGYGAGGIAQWSMNQAERGQQGPWTPLPLLCI